LRGSTRFGGILIATHDFWEKEIDAFYQPVSETIKEVKEEGNP
jgi:hypothetical protein